MIITIPIERNIAQKMQANNLNTTDVVNAALAKYFSVKTHSMVLDEVTTMLDTYLKGLTVKTGVKELTRYDNNLVEWFSSNEVKFKGHTCYLCVTLSDGIISVVLRSDSVSKKLRKELHLIKSKNNNLDIQEGTKMTQIGLISREHKVIDSMTANDIYNYLLYIFKAIGGIDQLQ